MFDYESDLKNRLKDDIVCLNERVDKLTVAAEVGFSVF